MRLRAAYTVRELAELLGWVDHDSDAQARHAACKRTLRFLRGRGVTLIPIGTGRQHLVPLGAFAAAFPMLWSGIVSTWRAAGVQVPTTIRCSGCGSSVQVPSVSQVGHGGTRRDTPTP